MTSETWVLYKIESGNESSILLLEEKHGYMARGILLNLIALVFKKRLTHLTPNHYAKFSQAIGTELAVVEDIVGSVGLDLINEWITARRKFIQNQRIKASKGGRAYVNNNQTGKQEPEDGIITNSDGTWAFDLNSDRFKQETKEFTDLQGNLPEVLRRLYAHFKPGKGSPYAYLKAILRKEKEKIGKYGLPNAIIDDPNVIVLRDDFYASFKNKFHQDYIADLDKDGKIFIDLLKVMSVDELKVFIDRLFDSDDKFIQESGYTTGVFKSQINKLRKPRKESAMEQSDRIRRERKAKEEKKRLLGVETNPLKREA